MTGPRLAALLAVVAVVAVGGDGLLGRALSGRIADAVACRLGERVDPAVVESAGGVGVDIAGPHLPNLIAGRLGAVELQLPFGLLSELVLSQTGTGVAIEGRGDQLQATTTLGPGFQAGVVLEVEVDSDHAVALEPDTLLLGNREVSAERARAVVERRDSALAELFDRRVVELPGAEDGLRLTSVTVGDDGLDVAVDVGDLSAQSSDPCTST